MDYQHSNINYIGTWTLFKKEVLRFLKVYNQTLIAPVITSLLFLAVFSLSIGSHVQHIGSVAFSEFVASGLIIMTVVQQVFANGSATFVMGKVLGSLVDLLMPPVSAGEIVLAMVAASVLRGLIVGVLTTIAVSIFIGFHIEHPLIAIFYAVAASVMLALLGLLAGILSESFDQMAAITSYVITPLSFLSGTFYSTHNLPEFWQKVAHVNPFFYMIDGFRYGITGYSDGDVTAGAVILLICNLVLWLAVYRLIDKGYRLKT
jgi:ABC-2 type transport system permease protein